MSVSAHVEDEVFGKAYDARLVRRLLRYIRPYARGVVLAMVMLIGLTMLELAGPLVIKLAIDNAIATSQLDQLARYAATYLAIVVGIFGLRFGQNYLLNQAGQRAM